ncbi:MAG: radical SAM protein [Candidatus Aureabacteria bacterium]|nr:radical SAM protein [Candidatus Auribacterota bacterium]
MILINSSPKDTLKIFQPFSRTNLPIGIGSLLAVTENKKIKARFIDEHVESNTLGLIEKYIKETEPPYIFGFSVLTAAFKTAVLTSRRVKELYPDSVICFGGIHPTAVPEEVLSYGHIDVVIRGEGEKTLPELYGLVKGRKDFFHLDGLSYKQNGRVIHNRDAPIIENLNELPPFPFHLFNPARYDFGSMVTSRGCPFDCIFCSNRLITGKRYRFRSVESVVNELDILHNKYHQDHILFLDDNFLVNKERIYILLEELKKRGFDKKMTFSFQARADSFDYKLFEALYDTGFKNLSLGLETASERMMKVLKKSETVKQCVEAAKGARQIGFHISAVFMYGIPGETHEERLSCAKMSKALKLDMVRFNNATPYPGTELYEIAKRENRLNVRGLYENFNSVSAFIENPFKKIPFSYVPIGSSEEELRMDILFSYFAFYFDINRIKKIFTRPDTGMRWFNPGRKIFGFLKKMPALIVLFVIMIVKFGELFFNVLLKRKTSISIREFIKIFRMS